jgi:phosphatidylglycerophosphatase A
MKNHSQTFMNTNTVKAFILFIAQGAYSGRFPAAPGTAGTIVGVLLFLLIKGLPLVAYLFVCVLVIGLGTWAAEEAEKLLGKKDAPSIVIDEIAGFLIAMSLIPPTWDMILTGFFLFRFLDIVKPWPLRQLQNLHGGVGIMIDDIGAGIYTNLILQASLPFIGGR